MKICIFGASSAHIDQLYIKAVEDLGYLLAKRGHSLVFGCGATGLMGAAARGFKRGGGFIHGVIPRFFRDDGIEQIYSECDKTTFTADMAERKRVMEDEAEAFIIVPGGIGTFEEFFEVFTLFQVGQHTSPIAVYNINNYYTLLKEFLLQCSSERCVTIQCVESCVFFSDTKKMIEWLENFDSTDIDWKDLLYGYGD